MTTKSFSFRRCDTMEPARLGDLQPMDTFCWSLSNIAAVYVEPGERPEWGGVPWQVTGHPPTGGAHARPDLTVYVPRERAR